MGLCKCSYLHNYQMSVFTQPLCTRRMKHKVSFSAEFNRFEFSFPSPRLVAIPKLKSPVCPTIYPYLEGEYLDSYPFTGVFALCEILTVLSIIWTWLAMSIFNEDHHAMNSSSSPDVTQLWYYSIAYLDSLFINPVCAHTVFERSTDKEWYNPSGNSDGWGDPLEQICLGVGNTKTRTLRQQLTIIYCSMYRLHTIAWKRESVRLFEQTQRDAPSPQPDKTLCMKTSDNLLTG